MKAVRKAFLVFIAALMVMGLVSPALVRTAYAVEYLKWTNRSSEVGDIVGTPSRVGYETDGTYSFRITGSASNLSLTMQKPGSSNYVAATPSAINDNKITYGGLEIYKKSGLWETGDTLSFNIVTENTDNNKSAFISSSRISKSKGGSATTSVKRNNSVYFTFVIVDPNISDTGKNTELSDVRCILNSDSFNQSDSGQNTVTVAQSQGGRLAMDVQIGPTTYTGKNNTLKFTLGYTVNGIAYEYAFSQNFPECKEYDFNPNEKDDDDDDDEKTLDPLLPHIIVSSYDYGSIQVSAGQTFDLEMDFTNTSDRYDLENVIMKVDSGEGFSITNSSNSYYIDSLKIGQTLTKTIGLQAAPAAKAQSYPIKVDFTFQYVANDIRKAGDSSESISIPITQPDRFQIDEIQATNELYVGDEYPISVSFVNKGKTDVYNVSAELRGDLPNNGERQFIGNVNSGIESSADFYIAPRNEGMLNGSILITYEDENMNVREVSKPFSIQVIAIDWGNIDGPDIDLPIGPVEPEEPASIWTTKNILLGLSAVGMAGLTTYLTIIRIKAKRSEMSDETI